MERDTIPLFYAESPQTTEPIDDIAPEHISVIAGKCRRRRFFFFEK